ncbi:hypothetical protein EVAR_4625_1 [Eumeta japonica]|uniref:Uncharacterized protein n=1 Tax=Eumeta variegata TaxID=151549 RepID=A0A4C1SW79_EUMVA|nr:hypothetical protein EVAR_4625_1 [Eumeta japonica]
MASEKIEEPERLKSSRLSSHKEAKEFVCIYKQTHCVQLRNQAFLGSMEKAQVICCFVLKAGTEPELMGL